jgi:putative transposase
MARKLRVQFEGAIYHVTARGNARRKVFLDDRDRDRFLWRLAESSDTYDVRIYLYCLMDNHFHLVIETPRANISRFMQSLLTGYTVYFNLRHSSSGHLFQGRYGAQLVEGDRYLLNLSRYVHLNPVHTARVKNLPLDQKLQYLRSYKWSTYQGYLNRRKRSEYIEYEPILQLLHGPQRERTRQYRRFIEGGLAAETDEFAKTVKLGNRAIGSREFRKWVDAEHKKLRAGQGDPGGVSFRREAVLVDVDEIPRIVASVFGVSSEDMQKPLRNNLARPAALQMLCRYGGLTQRAAAESLGYGTGAAASQQIKRLREMRGSDKKLARKLARVEKKIQELI